MLDVNQRTLHTYPSLLPLRMVLIAAESEAPSHPPRIDANEQRAMQLIEKVKAGYKKPLPFLNWNDIPSQRGYHESVHEMVIAHA